MAAGHEKGLSDMGSRTHRWWPLGLLCAAFLAFSPLVKTALAAGATTLDSVLVVPNPYTVSGRTYGPISDLKGYDQIRFTNLPAPCTVRIYTIAGNFVHELKNEVGDADGDRDILWNGRNSDNQYVVSDVYVYVVNSPTLGRKVGKLVVIR
jgi:hypothetical protein